MQYGKLAKMSKLLLREYHALCPDGVCQISLLTEEEKHLRANGKMILTGILQSADKINGNNRIYPRSVLAREVENYQKLVKERRALGELDHPDTEVVELKNASHCVLRTWWEGNDVWGSIQVLNTPSGKILQELVNDQIQLGVSSRSLGSLKESSQGSIVQDDLALICWDIVQDPSTRGAFMRLSESKIPEKKIFSKADRINRLLNKITQGDL